MDRLRSGIPKPDPMDQHEIFEVIRYISQSDTIDEQTRQSILRFINTVNTYVSHLNEFLDKLMQDIYNEVANRPIVGDLADRPSPEQAGWMYLANDQTPEELHVSDGTNWHQFNSV